MGSHRPRLIVGPGRCEPLKAAFDSNPSPAPRSPGNEPVGPLTPLVERYRGRTLPQAHRGFGLPEIYEAFCQALGRPGSICLCDRHLIVDLETRVGSADGLSCRSCPL